MLAVGARGAGGFGALLLGSVSRARHALTCYSSRAELVVIGGPGCGADALVARDKGGAG